MMNLLLRSPLAFLAAAGALAACAGSPAPQSAAPIVIETRELRGVVAATRGSWNVLSLDAPCLVTVSLMGGAGVAPGTCGVTVLCDGGVVYDQSHGTHVCESDGGIDERRETHAFGVQVDPSHHTVELWRPADRLAIRLEGSVPSPSPIPPPQPQPESEPVEPSPADAEPVEPSPADAEPVEPSGWARSILDRGIGGFGLGASASEFRAKCEQIGGRLDAAPLPAGGEWVMCRDAVVEFAGFQGAVSASIPEGIVAELHVGGVSGSLQEVRGGWADALGRPDSEEHHADPRRLNFTWTWRSPGVTAQVRVVDLRAFGRDFSSTASFTATSQ